MTEPGVADGGGVGLVVRNKGWTRDWSAVAILCLGKVENLCGLNGEEMPTPERIEIKCDLEV